MTWFWLFAGMLAIVGGGALFGAPYVPSRRAELRKLFVDGVGLTNRDVVVDIGSGDGIVLQEAIRAGASRAVGYEIHPLFVGIGWLRTRHLGRRVHVAWRNGWEATYPDEVTVVYAFVVQRDVTKLYEGVRRQAKRIGRPLTLISYGSAIPNLETSKKYRGYHIYQVRP